MWFLPLEWLARGNDAGLTYVAHGYFQFRINLRVARAGCTQYQLALPKLSEDCLPCIIDINAYFQAAKDL
jgi:hypothetical protein